jgi:hypothetical protein
MYHQKDSCVLILWLLPPLFRLLCTVLVWGCQETPIAMGMPGSSLMAIVYSRIIGMSGNSTIAVLYMYHHITVIYHKTNVKNHCNDWRVPLLWALRTVLYYQQDSHVLPSLLSWTLITNVMNYQSACKFTKLLYVPPWIMLNISISAVLYNSATRTRRQSSRYCGVTAVTSTTSQCSQLDLLYYQMNSQSSQCDSHWLPVQQSLL